MKNIQLTARFSVNDGKQEEFKKIAYECIAIVKEKEEGKGALQYDWFFNPDQTECVVRETYIDSNAFLTHMGNVGEPLGRILEISDFSAEVYGPISEDVKNAIAPFNPKLYNYL